MFSNSLHKMRRRHVGPEDYDPDAANPSLDLRYLHIHIQEDKSKVVAAVWGQFHAAL